MEQLTLEALLAMIQSDDPKVRTEGWLRAGQVGPGAIEPLARIYVENYATVERAGGAEAKQPQVAQALEVYRAARRGLQRIVRDSGAPGAAAEQARVVEAALLKLLAQPAMPLACRREVLWMISEIGQEASIAPLTQLIGDDELRQDAISVLQRIPGERSLAALQAALEKAPRKQQGPIAAALRARGVELDKDKYPVQKRKAAKPLDEVSAT